MVLVYLSTAYTALWANEPSYKSSQVAYIVDLMTKKCKRQILNLHQLQFPNISSVCPAGTIRDDGPRGIQMTPFPGWYSQERVIGGAWVLPSGEGGFINYWLHLFNTGRPVRESCCAAKHWRTPTQIDLQLLSKQQAFPNMPRVWSCQEKMLKIAETHSACVSGASVGWKEKPVWIRFHHGSIVLWIFPQG